MNRRRFFYRNVAAKNMLLVYRIMFGMVRLNSNEFFTL